jgi:serine/threonine-protein kinase
MEPDESLTRTSDAKPAAPRPGEPSRFAPGSVLAGRYRIVAALGRGGMGEVYRADDLKLGQTVALKFLPTALAADPARLDRFLAEVRLARQVTHPNVCRVHDIGDADGLHFISMEYVDGEDLAALLRRIGRPAQDRAAVIARQICAGLAAAHERGVLHRDLKPANVMIDGRGRARLTDFGLAVATGEDAAGQLAGTPAYMAPEQFDGRASERSDLYALGLVLFELFTGTRAFAAESVAEMARLQREAEAKEPSAIVSDLDPAIERAILRCLAKDPAQRPASAVSVAAELAGGDPLAAVLAAGETPAPELVAAAGKAGTLTLPVALALLGFVMVGLPPAMAALERQLLLKSVPLEMPPAALAYRARELGRTLGIPPGRHAAWGFDYDAALVAWAARRDAMPQGAPLIRFWYRSSPTALQTAEARGVTPNDPPEMPPGATLIWLDTDGRLLELRSVPEQRDRSGAPPDWTAVLAEAGLDATAARPVEPRFLAPDFAERQASWETTHGTLREALRVDAASYGSRATLFRTTGPWTPAQAAAPPDLPFQEARSVVAGVFLLSYAAAAVMAWRNLRLGRGDRKGAFRLAAFAFIARLVLWLLAGEHVADLGRQMNIVIQVVQRALYNSAIVWLSYIAIEPPVRRRWPHVLISWSRLLAGRFHDPLVGRDLLLGAVFAVAMVLSWTGTTLTPVLWGEPVRSLTGDLDFLSSGARRFLALLLFNSITAVLACLAVVVMIVVLRLALHPGLATASVIGLVTFAVAMGAGEAAHHPVGLVGFGIAAALLFVQITRFGFLSLVVTSFLMGSGRLRIPATLDFGAWYGEVSLAWLLLVYGLAGYGAYTSLGGKPLPKSAH